MKFRIYLAGSFNIGWRKELLDHVENPDIEWLLPIVIPGQREKKKRDPRLFVPRDIALIRRADILAGFWVTESSNIGLSAEIGLAYAYGVPTVVAIPKDERVKARFIRGLIQELDSLPELANFLQNL